MQKTNFVFCFLLLIATRAHSADSLLYNPGDSGYVNMLQVPPGVVGFDLGSAGSDQTLGLIIINSSAKTGFEVDFKFADSGSFEKGKMKIPFKSIVLHYVSGTLGNGPPLNDLEITPLNGGEYIWKPGTAPVCQTTDLIIEIRASWDTPIGKLAGFYYETVDIKLNPGQ
ncbi:MAG: hypothetical protein PHC61_12855 [Chitinivibrionales bacterium]|nr:hypothetical protein [Chitinivibrionales bacterium]